MPQEGMRPAHKLQRAFQAGHPLFLKAVAQLGVASDRPPAVRDADGAKPPVRADAAVDASVAAVVHPLLPHADLQADRVDLHPLAGQKGNDAQRVHGFRMQPGKRRMLPHRLLDHQIAGDLTDQRLQPRPGLSPAEKAHAVAALGVDSPLYHKLLLPCGGLLHPSKGNRRKISVQPGPSDPHPDQLRLSDMRKEPVIVALIVQKPGLFPMGKIAVNLRHIQLLRQIIRTEHPVFMGIIAMITVRDPPDIGTVEAPHRPFLPAGQPWHMLQGGRHHPAVHPDQRRVPQGIQVRAAFLIPARQQASDIFQKILHIRPLPYASISRISEKPVASNTSDTTSLGCRIRRLPPDAFILFCVLRSTLSPALEM